MQTFLTKKKTLRQEQHTLLLLYPPSPPVSFLTTPRVVQLRAPPSHFGSSPSTWMKKKKRPFTHTPRHTTSTPLPSHQGALSAMCVSSFFLLPTRIHPIAAWGGTASLTTRFCANRRNRVFGRPLFRPPPSPTAGEIPEEKGHTAALLFITPSRHVGAAAAVCVGVRARKRGVFSRACAQDPQSRRAPFLF